MSVLSIRSLPKEIEKAILEQAKKNKQTKTQVVIDLLRKQLGLDEKSQRKQKLLKFFGKMNKEDWKSFDESQKKFSQVDKEMWR